MTSLQQVTLVILQHLSRLFKILVSVIQLPWRQTLLQNPYLDTSRWIRWFSQVFIQSSQINTMTFVNPLKNCSWTMLVFSLNPKHRKLLDSVSVVDSWVSFIWMLFRNVWNVSSTLTWSWLHHPLSTRSIKLTVSLWMYRIHLSFQTQPKLRPLKNLMLKHKSWYHKNS